MSRDEGGGTGSGAHSCPEDGKEVAKWCEGGRFREGGPTGVCGRRARKTNQTGTTGEGDETATRGRPDRVSESRAVK